MGSACCGTGPACGTGFECTAGTCLTTSAFGDGHDGAAVLTTGAVNLHGQSLTGRAHPDADAYLVTSLTTTEATLARNAAGIDVGDEVLVVALRAAAASPGTQPMDATNVGAWETRRVTSSAANVITFSQPLARSYRNMAGTLHVVGVFRIPHYATLTVGPGSVVTGRPFQPPGTTNAVTDPPGGVLFLRVQSVLTVQSGAQLTMDGRGYRGGAHGRVVDEDGRQGEGVLGFGGNGAGTTQGYNDNNGIAGANQGGGGAFVVGAGGSYGSQGTGAGPWYFGAPGSAAPGNTYGDPLLTALLPGSGGGGMWWNVACNPVDGGGGSGGGALVVHARTAVINGSLSSNGTSAIGATYGGNAYAPGGGSGGALWLSSTGITFGAAAGLQADGAPALVPPRCGGVTVQIPGGAGGNGRFRLDVTTINSMPAAGFVSANMTRIHPAPVVGEAPN